jgi:hypothetical protein
VRRRLFSFRSAPSRPLSTRHQRRRAFLAIKCGVLILLCTAISIAWTRREHELYGLSLGTWRGWSLTASARTAGIVFEAHSGEDDWPGRRAGLFSTKIGEHWEMWDGCATLFTDSPDEPPRGERFLGFCASSSAETYHFSYQGKTADYPTGEGWNRGDYTVKAAWAVVPYWFVVLVVAGAALRALPAAVGRRRRMAGGRCAACGYDLRGSVDGRCSECGARSDGVGATQATRAWPIGAVYVLTVIVVTPIAAITSHRWNKVRYAMPRNVPLWTEHLNFAPEWAEATGRGRDRMLRTHVGGKPLSKGWYQAVWHTGGDDFLVVVRYAGGVRGPGDTYSVYIFNRKLSLVREGRIITSCPVRVYGLYEVRSDEAAFPEAYRGKWCLGIGVSPHDWPVWEGLPTRELPDSDRPFIEEDIEQDRKKLEQLGREGYNPVYIQPVDWDDVPKKDEWWQIHLEDVKQEFRFAEAAADGSSK